MINSAFIKLCIGLSLLLISASAMSREFTVNTELDRVDALPGDRLCQTISIGECSLRAAIMEANASAGLDTINFKLPTGNYTLDSAIGGELLINDSLEIIGADRYTTIISGDGRFRLFSIPYDAENPVELNLSNLTLTRGRDNDPDKYAAIYNESLLNLDNVTVTDAGTEGYAIASVSNSGLTIQNSFFIANDAAILSNSSMLVVNNSEFKNNNQTLPLGGAAIFALNSPLVEIQESLFEGNSTTFAGGALFLKKSNLVIANSTLNSNAANNTTDNETANGGAIYAVDSKINITNTTITNNTAKTSGGGIYCQYCELNLSKSHIEDNKTALNASSELNGSGGGLIFGGVENNPTETPGLTITDTVISSNSAANGGGIAIIDDVVANNKFSILNSEISFNNGEFGGGIFHDDNATLRIVNSTISNNTAETGGGVLTGLAPTANINLQNVTLAENSAVLGTNINNQGSQVLTSNSIFANAVQGNDCEGTITSFGSNLDSDGSCNLNPDIGDFSATDPELQALSENDGLTRTHALAESSPAIDAGDSLVCMSIGNIDQRHNYRANTCDIGAFEAGSQAIEAGTLEFTQSEITVYEDVGIIKIPVRRADNAQGYASAKIKPDGTATPDLDFIFDASDLSWIDGDNGNKEIILTLSDDNIKESIETIVFEITNVTGEASIGQNKSIQININDDDSAPGKITFEQALITVDEDAGEFDIKILRQEGNEGDISFIIQKEIPSKDKDGNESIITSNIPVTLLANDTSKIINEIFETEKSPVADGDKIHTYKIIAEEDIQLGENTTLQVRLKDNDRTPGIVSFSNSKYSANELDETFEVTIQRTGGAEGDIELEVIHTNLINAGDDTDVTAHHGIDYVVRSENFIENGKILMRNGESEFKLIIDLKNDSEKEYDEAFKLELVSVTGGAKLAGTNIQATTTILDDDRPKPGKISFAQSEYSFSESAENISVPLLRSEGTEGEVEVTLSSEDGTAIRYQDFNITIGNSASDDIQLVFNENTDDGKDQYSLKLDFIDNNQYEGDKTFKLIISDIKTDLGNIDTGNIVAEAVLSNPTTDKDNDTSSDELLEQISVTITITDNERPVIEKPPSERISEGAGLIHPANLGLLLFFYLLSRRSLGLAQRLSSNTVLKNNRTIKINH